MIINPVIIYNYMIELIQKIYYRAKYQWQGHDPNAVANIGPETTFVHRAATLPSEFLKKEIYGGGNPNITDVQDNTPLHLAAAHSRLANVKFLIRNGAYLNAKNGGGFTPLHMALAYTNPPIDQLATTGELLAQGAEVHIDSYGDTVFDMAEKKHILTRNGVRPKT